MDVSNFILFEETLNKKIIEFVEDYILRLIVEYRDIEESSGFTSKFLIDYNLLFADICDFIESPKNQKKYKRICEEYLSIKEILHNTFNAWWNEDIPYEERRFKVTSVSQAYLDYVNKLIISIDYVLNYKIHIC